MAVPLIPLGGSSPASSGGGPGGSGVAAASPTLLGALVARFGASTILIAAVPTGCYMGQEPETDPVTGLAPVKPFAVLTHEGEIPEWNSEQEVDEKTSVTFHILARDAATAELIALKVKNRFDWGQGYDLNVTGATTTAVDRTNFTVRPLEQRDEDGQVVHDGQVMYDVLLHRKPVFDTV